jgi:hypothetical protein
MDEEIESVCSSTSSASCFVSFGDTVDQCPQDNVDEGFVADGDKRAISSFEHARLLLDSSLGQHGLRCRVKDSPKNANGGERKKFVCCVPRCTFFAWFGQRLRDESIVLNKHCFSHSHSLQDVKVRKKVFLFEFEEQKFIDELQRARVRPISVHTALEIHFDKVFDEMVVRNYMRKGRKKQLDDIPSAMRRLKELQENGEADFDVRVEDGMIDGLFIAPMCAVAECARYGSVIGIDATSNKSV